MFPVTQGCNPFIHSPLGLGQGLHRMLGAFSRVTVTVTMGVLTSMPKSTTTGRFDSAYPRPKLCLDIF